MFTFIFLVRLETFFPVFENSPRKYQRKKLINFSQISSRYSFINGIFVLRNWIRNFSNLHFLHILSSPFSADFGVKIISSDTCFTLHYKTPSKFIHLWRIIFIHLFFSRLFIYTLVTTQETSTSKLLFLSIYYYFFLRFLFSTVARSQYFVHV